MSAFLVTTKRACPACVHGPAAGGEHQPETILAERSCPTMDAVWRYLIENGFAPSVSVGDAVVLLDQITEEGGTITLRRGVTITVKPVAS